jgi:hypothetical protein
MDDNKKDVFNKLCELCRLQDEVVSLFNKLCELCHLQDEVVSLGEDDFGLGERYKMAMKERDDYLQELTDYFSGLKG